MRPIKIQENEADTPSSRVATRRVAKDLLNLDEQQHTTNMRETA
jgi:hypothetical protein